MTPLAATARIQPDRHVFTLINTFHVTPEAQSALADELAAVTGTTMRHLPGFVAASVHKSLDGHFVVNYVQWETRAHFDAMLAHEPVKAHLARVKALAIDINPVFYAVSYVGAREA